VETAAACWILHVDMDAFFASVEALDDPTLRGRPLIVGGLGPRGVVASCSYEARVFGVRSAMPAGVARRLCPKAVFVAGRHARYAEVSRHMHEVFQQFTPVVEGISLDEAFLDVTGAIRRLGSPMAIAGAIRAAIGDELGLSCSVGGSTVKFLAKLASEAAKPQVGGAASAASSGVCIVEPGRELEFLHPHPIDALWGVGPATAQRLKQLGISTIGDLAAVDPAVVEGTLGRAVGAHLAGLSRGIDERAVEPHREVKSVSHEETYPADRRDRDGLRTEVLRMSDSVATRLRQAGLIGRTVTLKIRYGDFSTHTRSVTGAVGLDDGPAISEAAARLLADLDLTGGIRLLGVGVSNLFPAGRGPGEQLTLDLDHPSPTGRSDPVSFGPNGTPGDPDSGRRASPPPRRAGPSTSGAIDAIRRRFGDNAVGPAALLGSGGLRVKRPGDTQWGPCPVAEGPSD
jgi:DNA polymerase-4